VQSTPQPRRGRTSVRRAVAGTLLAGLLFAACGDDDDTDTSTDAGDTTTTVADDHGSDHGETVTVDLVNFAFEKLPETVPAGTKFEVVNKDPNELHEFVAFKLADDETRSADEIAALPMEELMAIFSGEPATVLLAPPGGAPQIAAVGDGSLADPGRYLIMCAIPTGVDPDEYLNAPPGDGPPQIEGAGPPHFMAGMYAELTVD
jgi:uncharacterized cupredoxin-like copper-binding protein